MKPLTLRFHPAKEQQGKALVLTFVLGIGLQVLWKLVAPVTAIILFALLIASLRDFFLETTYTFDEQGLRVGGLLKAKKSYGWNRFRTFINDRNGLFLTPYRQKRRTEQQRGVFLAMDRDSKQQAIEFCQSMELEERSS